MYDETYEEYIRSILGYPTQSIANMIPDNYAQENNTIRVNQQLKNYYPEVYKVLQPMVTKLCMENTNELTQEEIERMTDEIYTSFENSETPEKGNQENRQENRNVRDRSLMRDLIKILILQELLGNSRPPKRPPNWRPNPRPPFGPNFPVGPRPPMMPRNNYYQNLYE